MSRRHEALVAQAARLTKFESAVPCKKCGTNLFYASTSMCCQCLALRQKANRQKANISNKKWREANKEKQKEAIKDWYFYNPGMYAAYKAARRAAELNRTPPWADTDAIKQFYANCPTDYHVDHIIPLRGKLVSGLHVIENLQYLPAKENCAKGNKFDVY